MIIIEKLQLHIDRPFLGMNKELQQIIIGLIISGISFYFLRGFIGTVFFVAGFFLVIDVIVIRFVIDDGFYRMRNHPSKITAGIGLYYKGVSLRKVQEHFQAFYPHNSMVRFDKVEQNIK